MTAATVLDWLREHVSDRADLHLDSRAVRAGDVYVAVPGATHHGSLFIEQAVAQGAAAVLCDDQAGILPSFGVPLLRVPAVQSLLGAVGDQWYDSPSAAVSVIATTGTNGKTSVSQWLVQALTAMGKPCAAIGTLGVLWPDGRREASLLTTPDVLSMHCTLARLRDAGAGVVAIEASSIGIAQGRLDGVRVALAAFTNLSRDHLDFHGDMAAYESAKARLFFWPGLTAAIVNLDDIAGARLAQAVPAAITYSLDPSAGATVYARAVLPTPDGQTFTLVLPRGEARVVTSLLGLHNVQNMLLVAGVLHQLGWSVAHIAGALAALVAVEGRLEVVAPLSIAPLSTAADLPLAVVDYAHTPDALMRALQALRPVADARDGRLICVFGCGGDRDPGKRAHMGRVASGWADALVITSDNPRTESPTAIIEQIAAGVGMRADVSIETDRALAVLGTLWRANSRDVVLVAGKGHETYQEVAGERTPFDDREWVRLAMLLAVVPGVSTDTRKLGQGELFIALNGPNFDGHAYLDQAAQAGACAAVVAQRVANALPQVVLGPTGAALLRMGKAWRQRFELPVIVVAGSNGKTTTKEMVAVILAEWLGQGQSLATAGNFNNEIGLPLTLLRLRPQHRVAVFEVGMNHPGEIAVLAAATNATVALVTNAQREHQEFMYSVEAVARENGAVFEALPTRGMAVYPRDDEHAAIWDAQANQAGVGRTTFGAHGDVYAEQAKPSATGTLFRMITPQGAADVRLQVPGDHNVRNALAATAVCLAAGAPLHIIVRGLEAFQAVAGRLQQQRLANGIWLIDDTYNANPDSVRAAIDVLVRLPGPRVLVLGDMGEVGDDGPAVHQEVGAYAHAQGIEVLLTMGQASVAAVQAFGAPARACGSIDEVMAALRDTQPASVLVKGSRFMRMERVVKELIGGRHAA
jgi:murE/murF fusion protein